MSGWAAVVGTRRTGTREVVDTLLASAHARGVGIAGFFQLPVIEGGEVLGYDLVGARSGERVPLARPSAEPDVCRWSFLEEGFEAARRWALGDEAPIVLAEAGSLEAALGGHFPTVRGLVEARGRLVVLLVRPSALAPIALRLPDPEDAIELPASAADIVAFADRILACVPR